MKFKLYDFWLSMRDLIAGRRELVYELTFLMGIINAITGLVSIATIKINHPWYIFAGILILFSGISGVITAVIPYEKIRKWVDSACFLIMGYGGIQLIIYDSLRQLTIAFVLVYMIIYVWIWRLQGVHNGIVNSKIK